MKKRTDRNTPCCRRMSSRAAWSVLFSCSRCKATESRVFVRLLMWLTYCWTWHMYIQTTFTYLNISFCVPQTKRHLHGSEGFFFCCAHLFNLSNTFLLQILDLLVEGSHGTFTALVKLPQHRQTLIAGSRRVQPFFLQPLIHVLQHLSIANRYGDEHTCSIYLSILGFGVF